MAVGQQVQDSWRVYTVKVVDRVVDPDGLAHTYTVQGLELHNQGRQYYAESIAPFRRLFPPPIKIEALTVGETGVVEVDTANVPRFHPHTPERPLFQIECPNGGDGGDPVVPINIGITPIAVVPVFGGGITP